MARETLKNFLNLKGFATDTITPTYNQTGHASREQKFDLGRDAGTGKELLDLADEGAGLLGDYLNYIADNSNSIFSLNAGNEEAAPSNRGDSLVIAEEQGASNVFVEQGTVGSSKLNENSNSGYFGAAGENLGDIVDKTGAASHAHNLLSDIEGSTLSSHGETLVRQEGENNKVTKAVESVLAQNNRFANVGTKNAYATKGSSTEDFESGESSLGVSSSQNVFGHFDLDGSRVTLDQLKSVGVSLLYKASGYDTSDSPGSSNDIDSLNDQILNEESSSSLFSQEGYSQIDFRNLRTKYAKGSPENEAGDSTRDNRGDFLTDTESGDSTKSFGVNFNATVNFSGRGRKILKLKSALACLALKKVTKDFMDQIGDFIKFNDLKSIQQTSEDYVTLDKSYAGPGPHAMGSYRQLNSFELDTIKKLVLVRTDYPYPECFEKGIEVFFGADDEVDKIKETDHVSQAPGYWLSVASSVLKSFDQLSGAFQGLESFESESIDKIHTLIDIVRSNKLIRFANAAATVGDIFYKSNGGLQTKTTSSHRPFDVDSMPSGPGSRVAKSRDSGGESPLALSWRQGSVPSMYLLPRNVVKATVDLNNIFDGASPTRGMLSSVLVKNTYLDRAHGGSYNRIPNDVVKRLEDKLEAEYVPFYIQDLRTNEVISFHAFLSNLTDNIKADFTPVSGYGRLDPVQVYKSTTRTVGVTFILYATSKEDFDSMWYKINKLTTLVYPQWTQGTQLSTTGVDRFVQPFSQVLGASPIVRLRVGDVIKSNYSRFNLARMFGIGDQNINPIVGDNQDAFDNLKKKFDSATGKASMTWGEVMTEIFYVAMGTPFGTLPPSGLSRNKVGTLMATAGRSFLSNFLINGFVNPFGANLVLKQLIDPNTRSVGEIETAPFNMVSFGEQFASSLLDIIPSVGYTPFSRALVKANTNRGYEVEDGTVIRITRPLKGVVLRQLTDRQIGDPKNLNVKSDIFKSNQTYDGNKTKQRTRYEVLLLDPAGPWEMFNKKVMVDHQDLAPDPKDIFMRSSGALLGVATKGAAFLDALTDLANDFTAAAGTGTAVGEFLKMIWAPQPSQFMEPENNPFTRALESTMGRGLAGVIDGFNFNWLSDYTWETDYNSRAPKGVEISFNLQVIHDLPPGLDHSGYNRAPLYNVGDVMKEATGDAHGDDATAEFEYRRAGNSTFSKTGK